MRSFLRAMVGVVLAGALVVGVSFAQSPSPQTGGATGAPQKIEGQVVSVDMNAGKVTVKGSDGTTHEFQAPKETLQNLKPGDKIEAQLRQTK